MSTDTPTSTDPPVVAAKGRDLVAAETALRPWLAQTLGIATDDVAITEMSYPLGAGYSNETILLGIDLPAGPQGLVLRIAPRPQYQMFMDPEFHTQFRLLGALHRTGGVNVPEPLWFEPDTSVLGQEFFVMRRMFGRVPVSTPVYNQSGWLHDATPTQRRSVWVSAMHQLAAVHAVPLDAVGFVGETRGGRPGLKAHFAYWTRFAEWAFGGRLPERLVEILERLRATMPEPDAPRLTWGDARIGNMMFGNACSVLGVMDWEQASLAGHMVDIGWWLLFDQLHSTLAGLPRLDGLGTRQETVDLYQELTGLRVHDLEWHEHFAAVRAGSFASRSRGLLTTRTGDSGSHNPYLDWVCRQLDMAPWEEA